jgi:peptidyl-prolyl cis-trans isomerase SurA
MQAGEVRGPFRSNAGFHIIKVEAFRQPQEERRLVRQTNARHILIRTNEITADSDARTRLQQLRERVTAGDDFANLARSHSDDQASAIKGGDIGWVGPGKMVPEFEETMDATAIGQVSQPFKTRFGWHIVQVLDRRQHDETEQARRDAARKALRDRKAEEATEQYKRRLRGEAYVDLRLEVIE